MSRYQRGQYGQDRIGRYFRPTYQARNRGTREISEELEEFLEDYLRNRRSQGTRFRKPFNYAEYKQQTYKPGFRKPFNYTQYRKQVRSKPTLDNLADEAEDEDIES